MSDLSDLYQDMILDHFKHPRNFGELPDETHCAHGHNPLCGDQINIHIKIRDNIIEDIRFEGSGCAISKASASLMTAHLKGKNLDQARGLFQRVHDMLTGDKGEMTELEELGKLAALSGVCEFPVRVKCATLAWHTLLTALENKDEPASTE